MQTDVELMPVQQGRGVDAGTWSRYSGVQLVVHDARRVDVDAISRDGRLEVDYFNSRKAAATRIELSWQYAPPARYG